MSILRFLGFGKSQQDAGQAEKPADRTGAVREMVEQLDRLPRDEARYIAAFAYLMGRVAHADLDISDEETAAMEKLVQEQAGLPEEQAVLIVQMAKQHARLFGGTEDYLVGREFDRMAGVEQKRGLIRCLFGVAAADQSVSTVEDNEIRQIATELHLDREDYTAIKADFSKYLAVLKK